MACNRQPLQAHTWFCKYIVLAVSQSAKASCQIEEVYAAHHQQNLGHLYSEPALLYGTVVA